MSIASETCAQTIADALERPAGNVTPAGLLEPVEALVEHRTVWRDEQSSIDRAARRIANVLLTGADSRNGHRYSEQSLREAAPLYDRKPVFLDHAANAQRPYERSTRDLAGTVIQPRYEAGQVRGDIELLDTEAGRTLLGLLDAETTAVGMSHVVLAQRSADRSVVEKIHDVVSVDAVVFPATTRGLREQLSLDEAAEPEVIAPVAEEPLAEPSPRDAVTTIAEGDTAGTLPAPCLTAGVSTTRVIHEWIREQGLPPGVCGDEFVQIVAALPDRSWQRRAVLERASLLREWQQRLPRSSARPSAACADDRFVAIVRRGRRATDSGPAPR